MPCFLVLYLIFLGIQLCIYWLSALLKLLTTRNTRYRDDEQWNTPFFPCLTYFIHLSLYNKSGTGWTAIFQAFTTSPASRFNPLFLLTLNCIDSHLTSFHNEGEDTIDCWWTQVTQAFLPLNYFLNKVYLLSHKYRIQEYFYNLTKILFITLVFPLWAHSFCCTRLSAL